STPAFEFGSGATTCSVTYFDDVLPLAEAAALPAGDADAPPDAPGEPEVLGVVTGVHAMSARRPPLSGRSNDLFMEGAQRMVRAFSDGSTVARAPVGLAY